MDDFDRFWQQWYAKIAVFSTVLLHRAAGFSAEDREDAVQEIIAKLWRYRARYDTRWALSTWVYRVARNHLLDIARRKRRVGGNEQPEVDVETLTSCRPDPAEIAQRAAADNELSTAVAQLPAVDQQILHLRYSAGLRITAIATVLRLPAGTVRSRHHRALKTLKQRLEARQ